MILGHRARVASLRTLWLFVNVSWWVVVADAQISSSSNVSTNFSYLIFDRNTASASLRLEGNATYSPSNAIDITPSTPYQSDSLSAMGQVFYNHGIQMRDPESNSTASFNTSFTFTMVRYNLSDPIMNGADGITFFMVANGTIAVENAENGYNLGLFHAINWTLCGTSHTSTFAVEFDTFYSPQCNDSNNNHVGVDINSAQSVSAADANLLEITLNDGIPITAWVEYDHSNVLLEVRISNSTERPKNPLISLTRDLSSVLEDTMWAGFSGSTGAYFQYQTLDSWSFIAYGLPTSQISPVEGPSKSRKPAAVPIGVGVGLVGALLGLLAILYCCRYVRSKGSNQDDMDMGVDVPHRFTYKQLSVATDGFSAKSQLGSGGFGCVYRGTLPRTEAGKSAGTPVAVKRMNHDSKQGVREFLAEVSIISRLRHRNLVQLLGWCKDDGKFLLVYELMPNGSLDQVLFPQKNDDIPVLPWPQRLKIVRGIAAALHYLHEGWQQQVIHRDVKASNVMLDGDFNAKLGDFGLAKLIEHQSKAQTTVLAGTWGYIAPECVQTGTATEKSDVYSFGALLLEIACGKQALDRSLPHKEGLLVDRTWNLLSDDRLLEAADERLLGDFEEAQMRVVLLVGLLCSHPDPSERPNMRHVTQILAGEAPVPPIPTSQPVANYNTSTARLLYQSLILDAGSITSSDRSSSSGFTSTTSQSSRVDSATATLLKLPTRSEHILLDSSTSIELSKGY